MVKSNLFKKIGAGVIACLLFGFVSFVSVLSFSDTVRAESVVQYNAYYGNNMWSPFVPYATRYESGQGGLASSSAQLEQGYFPPDEGGRNITLGYLYFQVNFRQTEDGQIMFAPIVKYAHNTPYIGDGYYPTSSVLNLYDMSRASFQSPYISSNVSHFWYHGPIRDDTFVTNPTYSYIPYVRFTCGLSSDAWTPNIIRIVMDSWTEVVAGPKQHHYNRIRYYDSNNEYAEVNIQANEGALDTYETWEGGWEPRTYFLANPNEMNQDLSYNMGYADGSANGFDIGYNQGYSEAFDGAFENGRTQGYAEGLNAGRLEKNTFFALITALIDAPLQAIYNAFDFEILGMNLRDFFLGLLSVAIIIFVIRFVTGRKGG